MEQRGFPPQDPLYKATLSAWEALAAMNKQWHQDTLGGSYSIASQPRDKPQPNSNERRGD
jgi:hypothetical protein